MRSQSTRTLALFFLMVMPSTLIYHCNHCNQTRETPTPAAGPQSESLLRHRGRRREACLPFFDCLRHLPFAIRDSCQRLPRVDSITPASAPCCSIFTTFNIAFIQILVSNGPSYRRPAAIHASQVRIAAEIPPSSAPTYSSSWRRGDPTPTPESCISQALAATRDSLLSAAKTTAQHHVGAQPRLGEWLCILPHHHIHFANISAVIQHLTTDISFRKGLKILVRLSIPRLGRSCGNVTAWLTL